MLTDPQIERYARHVLLREVGGAGQERLLAARVRIVGLDAAGSWAAAYLALAGVGILELDDPRPLEDAVPLLVQADRGKPRDAALAAALPAWNPEVRAVVRPPPGAAPDLLLRCDAAFGPGSIGCLVRGEEVLVAWGEACAACRQAAEPAGARAGPAVAALAGSLAAGEVVLRLLGRSAPRMLRLSGGRPVAVAPCAH